MRSLCVAAALLLASANFAYASKPRTQLRAVDPTAAAALERALTGSEVVRQLADEIERSDVIVPVETCSVMPMGIAGRTSLAHAGGGYRYVRIAIDRDLLPDTRAALLGHEL